MGYSRSELTLRKLLPQLQPLAEGRLARWVVQPDRAWYFASKIREALYIAAEVYPGRYPELARARSTYTIEVLDNQTVQARPALNTPAQVVTMHTSDDSPTGFGPATGATPTHGLETASAEGLPRQIEGMRSVTDIIAYMLRTMPSNDKMVFTGTGLSDAELDQLARWASSRTPALMVVYDRVSGIVTIAPHQPGVPVWPPKPSSMEPAPHA